jgi:hypothetical protein
MDAGYEIWYGVTANELDEIAQVTPDQVIDLAAAKFGPDSGNNRILGEREFFAESWDRECFFSAEYSENSKVLYAPRPSEDRDHYGFGVELLDCDWDFEPREFPLGMPSDEEINEAHNIFVAAVHELFSLDAAQALINAARCRITPYYL